MLKLILTLSFLFIPTPIFAVQQSTFELGVYPIDCIFETVNDGSNRVNFLTPKECGQEVTVITNESPELQETAPITVIPSDDVSSEAPVFELIPTQNIEAERLAELIARILNIVAGLPPFSTMILTFMSLIVLVIELMISRFFIQILAALNLIIGKP